MDLIHDSRSDFVKITIDSPRSIPVKEISKIANQIRNDEGILSLFPNGCRLEVGTPGVGTDLAEKFQYEKNIGRKIYLKYYDDNYSIVSDIFALSGVDDDHIIVRKSKKDYLIMFKNILSAKIKVSFD